VAEDASDGFAVEDVGHVGAAATAARALEGVDLEAAAHQLGPRRVRAERCTGGRLGLGIAVQGGGVLVVVSPKGGDGPAPAVVGGPNAGVEDLVRS
jgi:hypothetical protein